MTYNKTTKPLIKPQPHKKATLTKKNNHHKTIKTNQTTKETTKNETKANTKKQNNNNKTTPTKNSPSLQYDSDESSTMENPLFVIPSDDELSFNPDDYAYHSEDFSEEEPEKQYITPVVRARKIYRILKGKY